MIDSRVSFKTYLLVLIIILGLVLALSSCRITGGSKTASGGSGKASWKEYKRVEGHKITNFGESNPLKKYEIEISFPRNIPDGDKTTHYFNFLGHFRYLGPDAHASINITLSLNDESNVLHKSPNVVSTNDSRMAVNNRQNHQQLISNCVGSGEICTIKYIVKLELQKGKYQSLNGHFDINYEINGPVYKELLYAEIGRKDKPSNMSLTINVRDL